jgi:hypothetical protein
VCSELPAFLCSKVGREGDQGGRIWTGEDPDRLSDRKTLISHAHLLSLRSHCHPGSPHSIYLLNLPKPMPVVNPARKLCLGWGGLCPFQISGWHRILKSLSLFLGSTGVWIQDLRYFTWNFWMVRKVAPTVFMPFFTEHPDSAIHFLSLTSKVSVPPVSPAWQMLCFTHSCPSASPLSSILLAGSLTQFQNTPCQAEQRKLPYLGTHRLYALGPIVLRPGMKEVLGTRVPTGATDTLHL